RFGCWSLETFNQIPFNIHSFTGNMFNVAMDFSPDGNQFASTVGLEEMGSPSQLVVHERQTSKLLAQWGAKTPKLNKFCYAFCTAAFLADAKRVLSNEADQ